MQTNTVPPARRATHPPNTAPLKHLLKPYTSTHPLRSPSPLPPSSRVDPKLTQRSAPPTSSSPLLWTIPTWIAFVRFALAKGWHIIWSLLRHALFGPLRKSWGYRMTFITSFMRNVADHTSLADIVMIRRLISLHHLVPLPTDAVVTPITFLVPRHTGDKVARGFMREYDLKETGLRELSGEWVVGNDVWKRLKAERRERNRAAAAMERKGKGSMGMIGRDSPDIDTESESGFKKGGEKIIYYVHGGAYYVGNAATHRLITIGVSKACNARVFAITYRLAPEHVFPLPLHDVLHGYLRLLSPPLSIPPENIIIMGDSAGGGLSLALCMYLRDEGYKMPSGLVLMSPWVDLTMSCGSWDENAELDVVPRPEADDHLNPVGCYLGPKGISSYLTHPYASPLFGDFHSLPPMLIQSGDSEVLRDEITLLAHKASLAGVDVTHELYEDMVHVFQMFTWLPSAKTAIDSVGRWVRSTLPQIEQQASRHPDQVVSEAVGREVRAGAREVNELGEEVGAPMGRLVVPEDEAESAADMQARDRAGSALHLDTGAEPNVDFDSLPRSRSRSKSRSGSPTPTRARSPVTPHRASISGAISPSDDRDVFTAHAPQLRRALTAIGSPSRGSAEAHQPSATGTVGASVSVTTSPQASIRRRTRRPTASLHASPMVPFPSISSSPARSVVGPGSTGMRSGATSPTPSIRMRVRSPTVGSSMAQGSSRPSTRERSMSHSDITHLVEGYVEGGAANETVVYAPGGQVRLVGVLGEDD